MPQQTYTNHARVRPEFHYVVFLVLFVNLIWAIVSLVRAFTAEHALAALLALVLVLMAGSLRQQILTVQDRLIRLEMRLRLRQVLPADLQAHIAALTLGQLIALRFASDAELPDLVREIAAGRLRDRKEIKTRVKDWQADYLRA